MPCSCWTRDLEQLRGCVCGRCVWMEMKVDKLKATDDLHIDDMIRIFIYTQIHTTTFFFFNDGCSSGFHWLCSAGWCCSGSMQKSWLAHVAAFCVQCCKAPLGSFKHNIICTLTSNRSKSATSAHHTQTLSIFNYPSHKRTEAYSSHSQQWYYTYVLYKT